MYINQHILTMTVPSNGCYERYTETCASFTGRLKQRALEVQDGHLYILECPLFL